MLFTSRPPLSFRFALLLTASSALMTAGCAGRPELPILEQTGSRAAVQTATQLEALLPEIDLRLTALHADGSIARYLQTQSEAYLAEAVSAEDGDERLD